MNSDCDQFKADGCDVAVIRVAIKDAKGRIVPTAGNLVKFSIEGPGKIIGTGNGIPAVMNPTKPVSGWPSMDIARCWFNRIKLQGRFA